MEANVPLDPHQFAHLRVSKMQRSDGTGAGIGLCRVCRREYGVMVPDDGLCNHPRCWQLARQLGWLEVKA